MLLFQKTWFQALTWQPTASDNSSFRDLTPSLGLWSTQHACGLRTKCRKDTHTQKINLIFFLMETVKRLEVTEVEIREGVSLEDVFGVEFSGYSVKL